MNTVGEHRWHSEGKASLSVNSQVTSPPCLAVSLFNSAISCSLSLIKVAHSFIPQTFGMKTDNISY